MTTTRPGIFTTVITAYVDAGRAFGVLWAPALMALSLFIVAQFCALVGAKYLADGYLGKILLKEAIELSGFALIVPFLISLHRYIILGETTHTYEFITQWPRVSRFAGWLLVFGLAASVPWLIQIINVVTQPAVVYYTGPTPPESVDVISKRTVVMIVVTLFVVVTRLMIVLPAIATDARGASLRNAFADTQGHAGYVTGATFLSLLPLAIPFVLFLFLMRQLFNSWALFYLVLTITSFIAITLAAAIASRLYLALGDRLNRPSVSATPVT